jgi:hypothetical protein
MNAMFESPPRVLPQPSSAATARSFDTGQRPFSAGANHFPFSRCERKACASKRAELRGRPDAFVQL